MKKNLNGNRWEYKFNTVRDFSKFLALNENTKTNKKSSQKTGDKDWNGTRTYEEFSEGILKNGNPELLKEVKKTVNKRVNELEHKFLESTQYNFDVVGDFFDIGTFMSGEPEHWLKEIKIKDDKFIHVKVGGVYPAKVSAETIKQNASSLIALMRVMEGRGFLTKIDICFNSENMTVAKKGSNLLVEIPIKDYNQPLDYRKVSTLLDTSFFRRGIFRLYELTYPETLQGNYGRYKAEDDYINLAYANEIDSLESDLLGKDK